MDFANLKDYSKINIFEVIEKLSKKHTHDQIKKLSPSQRILMLGELYEFAKKLMNKEKMQFYKKERKNILEVYGRIVAKVKKLLEGV